MSGFPPTAGVMATSRILIFDTTLRDGEQPPGFPLDAAAESVRFARENVDDVEFSAEDALRSDVTFLCQVIEAVIQAGATTINLPDTVGYSTPDETAHFFRTVRATVNAPDHIVYSAHCHDDLGLALANTLAAVEAGVRQVECTINGIGERAGNAALEEIVMAFRVRADQLPYTTAIETKKKPSDRKSTRLNSSH